MGVEPTASPWALGGKPGNEEPLEQCRTNPKPSRTVSIRTVSSISTKNIPVSATGNIKSPRANNIETILKGIYL